MTISFTQVAYMTDVVDRAASATPTDRVSLSRWELAFHHQQPTSNENNFSHTDFISVVRTNSLTSERSTYSSRSSRNSSIVSEKATTFNRNNSILSKDSAISEDISEERMESGKWAELGKKYGNNKGRESGGNKLIEDKISQLTRNGDGSTESSSGPKRPKDLAIAQKKLSSSAKSPSSKNFKELAEKWQTISVDSPTTPSSSISSVASSATLPRKTSKEKSGSPSASSTSTVIGTSPSTASTLPRRQESRQAAERDDKSSDEAPWSPGPPTGHPMENPYYQVSLTLPQCHSLI